jgi:hypothetical protein
MMVYWIGRDPTGTEDFLKAFDFISPYFNPSNAGNWTVSTSILLHETTSNLARRHGRSLAGPEAAGPHCPPLPVPDLVRVYNSLLPLIYQTLYSKMPNVSRYGDTSLKSLLGLAPLALLAPTVDFVGAALTAVNQTHQVSVPPRLRARGASPADPPPPPPPSPHRPPPRSAACP